MFMDNQNSLARNCLEEEETIGQTRNVHDWSEIPSLKLHTEARRIVIEEVLQY